MDDDSQQRSTALHKMNRLVRQGAWDRAQAGHGRLSAVPQGLVARQPRRAWVVDDAESGERLRRLARHGVELLAAKTSAPS